MGKKFIFLFLFILIILFRLPVYSDEFNNKHIKAAIPEYFPPHYYINQNGKPEGFAIDIMNSIASLSGTTIDYKIKKSWGEVQKALIEKEVDLIPNLGITEQRKGVFEFTMPVETFPISIFVRKNYFNINNIEDLKGKNVGVVVTNAAYDLFKKNDEIKLKILRDAQDAIFELLSGNVDAFVYPKPVMNKIARDSKIDHRIKSVGLPIIEIKRAIAVSKENKELLFILNQTITKFINSNGYKTIYEKWYGTPPQFWTNIRVIYMMAGVLSLTFIAMFLWRFYSLSKLNAQLINNIKREHHITKILIAIRHINQLIVKEKNPLTIIQEVCNNIVIERGYKSAWIIIIEPFKTQDINRKRFKDYILETAQQGLDDIFDKAVLYLKQGQFMSCISKTIKSSDVFCIEELSSECSECPLKYYYQSNRVMNIRLEQGDYIYGILSVSIDKDLIKDQEDEKKLFKELADDIAFALHNLQLEKNRNEILEEKFRVEQQLRHAQKMEAIGTLAGGIAHDFNNILTPIIGYTQILMSEIGENNAIKKDLEEIFKASKRAKDLVSQILTFSRQKENEFQSLKIQPIVKESLKLLRSSMPSTIEIIEHIDENADSVQGDPTRIHQVIMNLCTNAYHAMKDNGGRLEVTLSKVKISSDDILWEIDILPGLYIKLSISDSGHGMTEEILERIFEPYYTTKGQDEGTGLGLFIVHSIVKNHGGRITVYSEPEKGTQFNIYFPAVIKTDQDSISDLKLDIKKGSGNILIVDDDKQIIRLEKRMLEYLGYSVTAFTNSKEALTAFETTPDDFDVVITDLTMPNLTGDKLSQKIYEIRSDIPIILCTGFSEAINGLRSAKPKWIKGCLTKPILKQELSKKIKQVLNK